MTEIRCPRLAAWLTRDMPQMRAAAALCWFAPIQWPLPFMGYRA